MSRRRIPFVLALSLGMACQGAVDDGDPGSVGNEPGNEPGTTAGIPEAPTCGTLAPPLIRRLSSSQLRRTVASIFDDGNAPSDIVLTDPVIDGFTVDATASVVRDLDAQTIMNYANQVASWAVENKLSQLSACRTNDESCRQSFIRDFGLRAYRRPLSDDKVAVYDALFASQATFEEGAEAVIATMLQSPYFLYRMEVGAVDPSDATRVRLSSYEVATELSYLMTDGPPDADLLAAAADESILQEPTLLAETERLAATPAFSEKLHEFVLGWIEVEDLPIRTKDETIMAFPDALRLAMLHESEEFFARTFLEGGTVRDLFASRETFVNETLANHYGISGVVGDAFERVTLPPSRGAGILGHGSILARHALPDTSSPVLRGVMVRRRLMCDDLPDPPPNIDVNLPPPTPGQTTRERLAAHSEQPACRGCHDLIDPIGYAFEEYDTFGLFRTEDGGQPIDASSVVTSVEEGEVALDGLDSLSSYLGESAKVRSCFANILSYYAYGLTGCQHESMAAVADDSDSSLESYLVGLISSPNFQYRRAVEGAEPPAGTPPPTTQPPTEPPANPPTGNPAPSEASVELIEDYRGPFNIHYRLVIINEQSTPIDVPEIRYPIEGTLRPGSHNTASLVQDGAEIVATDLATDDVLAPANQVHISFISDL